MMRISELLDDTQIDITDVCLELADDDSFHDSVLSPKEHELFRVQYFEEKNIPYDDTADDVIHVQNEEAMKWKLPESWRLAIVLDKELYVK